MNATGLLLSASVLGLSALSVAPQARASTVTCESSNGGFQSCAVDTRGGVTLSRQLSSQGCWEGDTWGYDRNRIWVNNGCRAQFQVGNSSSSSGSNKNNAVAAAVVVGLVGAAILANKNKRDRNDDYNDWNNGSGNNWGSPRYTFGCESRNNGYTNCDSGRVRGQVEIYRQLSDRRCVYGQNWGNDRGQVWVDDGCRAEFAVY